MENTAPPYDFTWAFVLEDGVSCHGLKLASGIKTTADTVG